MRLYDTAPAGSTSRARSLRRNATDAEKVLWRALREAMPGGKWRRQAPIGPYVTDFLSYGARLVLEVDGGQHDEARAYDERRTAFLQGQGFRVLRFWNNDVTANLDGVLATIAAVLAESPSPIGRGVGVRLSPHAAAPERRASPSQPAAGPLPLPSGEG